MKYVTLAVFLACLYACSPNPVPPAKTPAQHELGADAIKMPLIIRDEDAPLAWTAERTSHIDLIETPKNANLIVLSSSAHELVRIAGDGRIFVWDEATHKMRQIHTDPEYRAALKAIMLGAMGCTNEKILEDATHAEP